MESLKHSIAIYVPSKDKHGEVLSQKARLTMLAIIQNDFTACFGGCTAFEGIGHYQAKNGSIDSEPIVIVRAFCKAPASDFIIDWAIYVRINLNQDSVAYEVDNQLYFV